MPTIQQLVRKGRSTQKEKQVARVGLLSATPRCLREVYTTTPKA